MMEKLKITEGEWEAVKYSDNRLGVGAKGKPTGSQVCIMNKFRSETEANAKAIVKAVNNTYGKGIDPEAVPDMKEALILAYKDYQNEGAESSIEYEQALIKALKKAEINV